MKHKYILVLILIITFNLLCIYKIFSCNKEINKQISIVNETKYELSSLYKWMEQKDSLEQVMINKKFGEEILFFNIIKDNIKINTIFRNNFNLVLFIPEYSCGYCLDAELKNINVLSLGKQSIGLEINDIHSPFFLVKKIFKINYP